MIGEHNLKSLKQFQNSILGTQLGQKSTKQDKNNRILLVATGEILTGQEQSFE